MASRRRSRRCIDDALRRLENARPELALGPRSPHFEIRAVAVCAGNLLAIGLTACGDAAVGSPDSIRNRISDAGLLRLLGRFRFLPPILGVSWPVCERPCVWIRSFPLQYP